MIFISILFNFCCPFPVMGHFTRSIRGGLKVNIQIFFIGVPETLWAGNKYYWKLNSFLIHCKINKKNVFGFKKLFFDELKLYKKVSFGIVYLFNFLGEIINSQRSQCHLLSDSNKKLWHIFVGFIRIDLH